MFTRYYPCTVRIVRGARSRENATEGEAILRARSQSRTRVRDVDVLKRQDLPSKQALDEVAALPRSLPATLTRENFGQSNAFYVLISSFVFSLFLFFFISQVLIPLVSNDD